MQFLSMPAAITRDLPDSKTGAKTIPFNGPALEVLANAERIEGNPRREGRQIPEGPAETLVAGAQGDRARRRADPRSQALLCIEAF